MRRHSKPRAVVLVIVVTVLLVLSTSGATAATTVAPAPDPVTGRMPFNYNDPAYPWPVVAADQIGGPAPKAGNGLERLSSDSALAVSGACDGVFGQQTDLVKQASRTNNSDGTVTLRVQLTTTLPPGEVRLRDCVWIDSTPNSQWDPATETLYAVDLQPASFIADPTTLADDSLVRFRVTFTAAATDRVCDQGARSEYEDAAPPQTPYLERSNTLCLDSLPDPVIPEAQVVALISMSALVLVGGFVVWASRRRRPAAAVA